MLRAELQALYSPDVPHFDLENYVPADPEFFGLLIEANIGIEGEEGSDMFSFVLCSPKWLEGELATQPYDWGRHYLFFSRFDYAVLKQVVEELCSEATGENWDEIAEQLGRYAQWEFEDYDKRVVHLTQPSTEPNMNTPANPITSRPYEDRDLVPICDLLNLCDDFDKLDDYYTVEELQQRFTYPTLDRFNDQRVWHDADNRLVGFAQAWSLPSEQTLDSYYFFRVHPDVRDTAVGTETIEWASTRAHEAGERHGLPAVLMGRIFDHDAYSRSLFEQHGFEIVRHGLRMARPLSEPIPEPTFPEGYTLRHAEGDDDIQPWVDCYNESFVDHWLFHPDTAEDRRHMLQRPGHMPEQDLVAVAPDGTFAAFCTWAVERDENARLGTKDGWIHLLGTRRGHRGIGLGRAMLLAGLQRIKAEGMDTAKLGVDAENPTGAVGLYERTGFRTIATRISYHKDV